MTQFLHQIMALPTVVFTALLGIVFVYWLFVILGALDIDMVDVGGDLDGVGEGALDGVAEGSIDAAAEGLQGAADTIDGAAESAGVGAEGIPGENGLSEGLSLLGFMSWLGLRNAPLTVVLSLVVLLSWGASVLGMRYFSASMGSGPMAALTVAFAAVMISLPITGLLSRPLGPLFHTREAEARRDLVGRTCVIETGSVDEKFGVATVHEDGRWPRIEVRSRDPNALRRGAEALIVAYDPHDETFRVEALTSPSQERPG